MEFLFGFIVCVTVIALLGHGIWVLVAGIVGALTGGREKPGESCPRCRCHLVNNYCRACNWPAPIELARRENRALSALQIQAQTFRKLDLIDLATYRSLADAIAPPAAPVSAPADQASATEAPATEATLVETPPCGIETPIPLAEVAPPPVPPLPPKQFEEEPVLAAMVVEEEYTVEPATAPLTFEERARQYEVRRKAALAAASPAAVSPAAEQRAPAPPAPPRRAISDLLAAFMEEKNIRWGELIGGLLIVCCSIALVISFWSAIAQRPLLKFLVFNGVTAALFGVGLYTEHRWKLRTTSRGLLIIATLLVPLNFLAIAAFSDAPGAANLLMIVGELISIALFAALVYLAGQILLPGAAWILVGGVMVPSVAQLLIRRFIGPESGAGLRFMFATIAPACMAIACGWLLNQARRWTEFPEERAYQIMRMLGLTSFAAALPLGLLLMKTGEPLMALRQIAPLLCLYGATPIASGLFLWKRLDRKELNTIRTAGMSVAVFGAMLLLAGMVAAWPSPGAMLSVAVINTVILTLIAIRADLPAAQLPAAISVCVAYLAGYYLATGQIAWHEDSPWIVADKMLSATSGAVMVPLVGLLAAASVVWSRLGRKPDAIYYASATAGAAVISIALVTWHGFAVVGDPHHASLVYAIYALVAGLAGLFTRRASALTAATALALAAIVQLVVYKLAAEWQLEAPWVLAFILHATLCACAAIAVAVCSRDKDTRWAAPLGYAGLTSSVVGAALTSFSTLTQPAAVVWPYWLWLAAIWLAIALVEVLPILFTVFQIGLSLAVALAGKAWLDAQPWAETSHSWLDPWAWQAAGLSLAALSLAWIVVRLVARRLIPAPVSSKVETTESEEAATIVKPKRRSRVEQLLLPAWRPFDYQVNQFLLLGVLALAAYAVIPGVAQELSPRKLVAAADAIATTPAPRVVPPASDFELGPRPHEHARGLAAWTWLALLGVIFVATLWERFSWRTILNLPLLAFAAVLLLATHWEPEVATASALRWLSAALMVVGALPIWFRDTIVKLTSNFAWPGRPTTNDKIVVRLAIADLFALSLAAPFIMTVGAAASAMLRTSPPPGAIAQMPMLGALCLVGLAIGAIGLALNDKLDAATFFAVPVGDYRLPLWTRHLWTLVLILGAAPLIANSLYIVSAALSRSPVLGPNPESIFARMGTAASYAVPVLLTGLTLVGFAIRERSSRFMFTAGLVFNVGVTAAYLLSIAKRGLQFDAVGWTRLAQLNGIVAASFLLAWIGGLVVRNRRQIERVPLASPLLVTQVGLAVALNLLVLLPAWYQLLVNPIPSPWLAEVASSWGVLSIVLALSASWITALLTRSAPAVDRACYALFALSVLAATSLYPWDSGNLLVFHTLLVLQVLAAALLVFSDRMIARFWPEQARDTDQTLASDVPPLPTWQSLWRRSLTPWANIAMAVSIAWGTSAVIHDSTRPWWSMFNLLAMALLACVQAARTTQRRYLYLAALLIEVPASAWWHQTVGFSGSWVALREFVDVHVLALALPAPLWMFIDLRFIKPRRSPNQWTLFALHRLVARLSLFVTAGVVVLSLGADAWSSPALTLAWLDWLALAATVMAVAACLWDLDARDSVAQLYFCGLAAAGLVVDQLDLSPQWLTFTGTIVLAAYSLATSYLWSIRAGLRATADRIGIPRRAEAAPFANHVWLISANATLAITVVALAYWIVLNWAEFPLRLLAGKAAIVQAGAIGLLARGTRRTQLQFVSLTVAAVGAVAWGWAFLTPGGTGTLLNYLVMAAASLAGVGVFYGLALAKFLPVNNDWTDSARRLSPVLVALSSVAIVMTLVLEVTETLHKGSATMAWPAILAVAATLVGLAVASLGAALLPGRDPLGMSERGRGLYVYAAEAFLGLAFMHIRLTMPWLFHGYFERYWPLVVMAIAFVGVGSAELFRRSKRTVLVAPLENTGAMLPLLPVIAFWIAPMQVNYSLLLLSVGLLYTTLAVTRRSFGFSILAALAANGGLWHLLYHQTGLGLMSHPQLWLIPPAICVLIASYLNRDQLTAAQMTSIRYATAIAIYASSTADIFLNGVKQAPWLPLVLAGLSIAGVFAGILLRVRAFLFLGTSFLVLSLLTIIWHAAVDLEQTWLWAATGIVAGIVIIAVFAVFEKKRQEILQMVEKLKEWQP